MLELITISFVVFASVIRWFVIKRLGKDKSLNAELTLFLIEMFVIGIAVGMSEVDKLVFLLIFISVESVIFRRKVLKATP